MAASWLEFGRLLSEARAKSGLTQKQLATATGQLLNVEIASQSIAQWQAGQHRPTDRETLLALCHVLHREGGLADAKAILALLAAAEHGAPQAAEAERWFPGLNFNPDAPPPPPAPTQLLWHEQVIEGARRLQVWLELEERRTGLGVIAVATLLTGGLWPLAAGWKHPLHIVPWLASLWVSSAVLAWPPSDEERAAGPLPQWKRKLYRFSGTASGAIVLAGGLIWGDGLARWLFGGAPLGWALALAAGGATFAYAGGLNVQYWCIHGSAGEPFYTRVARDMSGMMVVAVGLLGVFLVTIYPMVRAGYGFLLALAPTLVLLWPLIRRAARRQPA